MSARIRKNGVGVFFIYDHLMLQREEDDLKDAILYFYPPFVSDDDQCAMCGQLMGMSEFLFRTISKSSPSVFKLQKEKYCLKRIGNYTLGLEGNLDDSDQQLQRQLIFLYEAFVTYCGSINNIRQEYIDDRVGFVRELRGIWDILYPSGCWHDSYLTQAFQILPTVQIPKGKGEIFLQASNILQSSQRRPGVLLGVVVFKNKVLCTQASADLTRKLILVTPQLPCLHVHTDYELPVGLRLVSIYLTEEQHSSVMKYQSPSHKHNKTSKFVWNTTTSEVTNARKFSPSPFQQRRTSSSRTDFLHRKEMEIIPEKEDLANEPITNNKVKDVSDVANDFRKKIGLKNGQIWKPADHQTQITQVFESHTEDTSEEKSATDNEQSGRNFTGVTISDLEVETGENNDKLTESVESVERKGTNRTIFTEKNEFFNKSLTSSDDDGRLLVSSTGDGYHGNKPEVVIVAEMKGDITDSVEEEKENRPDIVISHCEKVDSEDSTNIMATHLEAAEQSSGGSNNHLTVGIRTKDKSLSPSVSSDWETTEPETSDAESLSPSVFTTAESQSSAGTDQRKERLDFNESESQGVSCDDSVEDSSQTTSVMKKEEMKSSLDDSSTLTADSVNSSLRSSKHSSVFSSQESASSMDTMSGPGVYRWRPADDNLHPMTLYVQGHSDISLLLLMDDSCVTEEKTIPCLWKGALPLLADLDFHVKDCLEREGDESFLDGDSYLVYDSFFHSLQGNVSQPITEELEGFQRLAGNMHNDFTRNNQITDAVFRTLTSSCYGHRTDIEETFYKTRQPSKSDQLTPIQNDLSFSTDITARQKLSAVRGACLL